MSSAPNITCPQCACTLKAVQVSSHYNRPFEVEQCTSCGGIWFDEDEYFRVSEEHVKKLDTLDDVALALKKHIPDSLLCPKDGEKLKRLKDSVFPKDIDIEWCPRCSGTWFNKGKFSLLRSKRTKGAKLHEVQHNPVDGLVHGVMLIAKERQRYRTQKEVEKVISTEAVKTTLSYILATGKSVPMTAWLHIVPILVSLYRVFQVSDVTNARLSSDQFQQAFHELKQKFDSQ